MTMKLTTATHLAIAAVALCGIGSPGAASAQSRGQAFTPAGGTGVVRIDLTGGAATQSVELPAGQSATVELPVDARDVMVTNPLAADVVLRSARHISVLGLKSGATDAVFFDAANRRILTLVIHVTADTSSISSLINRLLPGANVQVHGLKDSIILSGQVANLADADKAVQIAGAQVGGSPQVINMLSIAGKDQVMLKVRIVEVQRTIIKQLGINFQAVGAVGSTAFAYAASPTFAVNGALLGGGAGAVQTIGAGGVNNNSLTSILEAFERVGLIRTLAEPNLTAVSGESAKFLAGGEYPVPSSRDNNGEITVTFKPYGVGLGFTPMVLSGGRISLKISTEVSELDTTNGFGLGLGSASNNNNNTPTTNCTTTTTNGTPTTTCTTTSSSTSSSSSSSSNSSSSGATTLVIPALIVRRAETTVELPSGGAMMIAGLLQENSRQNLDGLPGLKNIPILGALFRSRDYLSGQTELVVIVTPYLVDAARPADLQTPADGLRFAKDTDTLLMGKLNRVYQRPSEATRDRTYQGPVGYVIE